MGADAIVCCDRTGHRCFTHNVRTSSFPFRCRILTPSLLLHAEYRTVHISTRGLILADARVGKRLIPSWLASNVVADCFIALASSLALRKKRTGFKRCALTFFWRRCGDRVVRRVRGDIFLTCFFSTWHCSTDTIIRKLIIYSLQSGAMTR